MSQFRVCGTKSRRDHQKLGRITLGDYPESAALDRRSPLATPSAPASGGTEEGAQIGVVTRWVGEEGVRYHAHGSGETRKGYRLLRQADLVCNPAARLEIVRRMYAYRFDEELDPALSLQQIRSMEGARVRRAYAKASKEFGVPWNGRFYDRTQWKLSNPVDRALSAANFCLNGLCHAAILSAGYAPGLGFVHTGKHLSFVYDVADLYKADLTVPVAFRLTAESTEKLETRVRQACRDVFHEARLLGRIIDDIDELLKMPPRLDDSDNEGLQLIKRPLAED